MLTEVAAVVAPLLHAYVTPPVAVKLILVVEHVNSVVAGTLIPAVGIPALCEIAIVSVSVQPLAPVTVTVYVPDAFTVVVAVVAPLLQAYVPPPVAVKIMLVVVQVNSVVEGGVIAAVGATVF